MPNKYYIELLFYKVYADLRAETEKTYIGFFWWIIDPIVFMLIFYVIFGLVLQRGTENFVVFLLIGLVAWRWFQNSITHASNSIEQSAGLINQVYIPKFLFPIIVVLTDLVKFFFVLSLLIVFLWISGFNLNIYYLALPIVIFIEFFLILSLSSLSAALVPFFPDLKYLISHILQMAFFLSGIFYSIESIPEQYHIYFFINPMVVLIQSFREILMNRQWPNWSMLVMVFSVAGLIYAVALLILKRFDRVYPKIPR